MISVRLVLVSLVLLCVAAKHGSDHKCFWGVDVDDVTKYSKVCVNQTSGATTVTPAQASDTTPSFAQAKDVDIIWVLLSGCLVFFMQCGFMCLEAGVVRATSVQNILFKNIMDACVGCVVWFLFGYTVAFGTSSNPNKFIGTGELFLQNPDSADYTSWFFQFAFAATSATIVSGSVAERCRLEAYFLYTVFINTWVYPVVVHWVWSSDGFLNQWHVIDFAGSGVVHMVGGFSGLCGAIALGPRLGRFEQVAGFNDTHRSSSALSQVFNLGHSVPLQVIGLFILWFGWFGFNAGSTLAATGVMPLAAKIAANTTLAAAVGGLIAELLTIMFDHEFLIGRAVNGILGGLVAITAGCAVVDPGAAIGIGGIGGIIYYATQTLLEYLEIDDPLQAFPVHGACGFWGVFSVGLFATKDTVTFGGYSAAVQNLDVGTRIARQLAAALVIAGWTLANSGTLFGILRLMQVLRIDPEVEKHGIDEHEHGGGGYLLSKIGTAMGKSVRNVLSLQMTASPRTNAPPGRDLRPPADVIASQTDGDTETAGLVDDDDEASGVQLVEAGSK